jgi:DNA-binding SARP family transcriptional activator/Tfp pilus assembly protein PilF
MDRAQVRLLGPVDVTVDGAPQPVAGLRRKSVLAVLGLHAGTIVSADRLIDLVWGEQSPSTAPNTLQRHVSYLRRAFGPTAAIVARSPGYLLDIAVDATDVDVAQRLIRQGMESAEPMTSASHLRAAVALWRGQPLLDVAGLAWLEEQADRLAQLRLTAVEALVEARLALGEHVALVPELEQLAQEHPFREHLHEQLMVALYRAGRQADALAAYQRLRRTLADEMGLDPNGKVRDLEAAILRQDPALEHARSTITLARAEGVVPAQLPLAIPAFAGRGRELGQLDEVLAGTRDTGLARPAAVVISAVSGTAGVGKTALAVHWAHRVRHAFPDGQLYVNLRGFEPTGSIMHPAEAVRGFLDALGVVPDRVPVGLDAQSALYRSALAGKRVLVVLDNARDAAQIRPLLPGERSCLVLVTSRHQLTSLVATEGAHPLTLDLLSVAEAHDLLTRRLGAARLAAEPDAVEEIINRCARLPVALAIVAARAVAHPGCSLTRLATELREATGVLDTLDGGDAVTEMRGVFSWSYRTLRPATARLFRLLGAHPGPDITAPATASLTGLTHDEAKVLLAELTDAHLLTEHTAGRHTLHDLLRAYAIELAHTGEPDQLRHAAEHRMLDHYLHTAHAAALLLASHRDPITLIPARPGVSVEDLADQDSALSWFTAEHPVLLAAVGHAARAGYDSHAWQLAWTMTTFNTRRGLWHQNSVVQHAALDAARRIGDPLGQAHAHNGLGQSYARSGRPDDARPQYEHALDLFRTVSDHLGQAIVHLNLAWVLERQDRLAEALNHSDQALGLYRGAGHQEGQARALNNIGWCHARLGEHQQALTCCDQALHLQQRLGHRASQADTWDSLGYLHGLLGNHQQAITSYQQALNLYREVGDRYNEGETLAHLGDTLDHAGDPGPARDAWRTALEILQELDHPDAANLRLKII